LAEAPAKNLPCAISESRTQGDCMSIQQIRVDFKEG
jgi:hypothetical protein